MRKSTATLLFSVAFILFSAEFARAEIFFAYLTGAQQVPVAATTARGYARMNVNETAGTIAYTIVFEGLSSSQTASHIHAPAPLGANTGVAINFGAIGGTSGTISGSTTITPTQIAQLRQHLGYVNVHTSNFPGGEIRGQLGVKRPVDFDGDGRMDLSVLRFPNVAPRPITHWNLNSYTGAQNTVQFGNADTDFPAPGDYDGDGKDDISVYRAGATVGAQSVFYFIRSSDSTFQQVSFGIHRDQNVSRDYDGDGITDIAIFRGGATSSDQTNWWIRKSTVGTAEFRIPFGTTGNGTTTFDSPVPGDYDGDGKFDVAVYRFGLTPANNFIVLRSSDGLVSYEQWGNFNSDYVVPGDYDGDGKYDYAVARLGANATSPMVWWIKNSSGGTTVNQFGLSSDLPTQGDYDGDGKADIAIYRGGVTAGAQSTFWVLNSLSGTASATNWGIAGDFAVNTFDAR